MGYDVALDKAWENVLKISPEKVFSLKFLADTYTINPRDRRAISLSCNIPAKDFTTIIILHYLVKKLSGLSELTDEWATFKELSVIEGYYAAFRERAIQPIIRKYGNNPDALLSVLDRLPGKKVAHGDVGIVLEVFSGVPALLILWRGDDEFGPEANILFDKSIAQIFCIEDIVVLAGMIASQI